MEAAPPRGPGAGPATERAPGPLAGILVADFSRVLAGPLATMFLADLGATVVKVEPPERGDDTRSWGPPYVPGSDMSTYFAGVNRNKRSITLDLAHGADQQLAHTLARRADVVIQNFRPGALATFGLDAVTVRAGAPHVVYCSISGFGTGAGAALPGYDFVVQAVGGLMSITGEQDGEPTKVGVALVDVLTGLHAVIGILAALRERDRTGVGQEVEVNLLSSLLGSMVNQGAAFANGAAVPAAMGNRHPSIAPYETLNTADAPLAVAVGNDRQFAVLVATLGRPELASDERFAANPARVAHRAELVQVLETELSRRPAAEWTAVLQAAGVACGPVQDLAGALRLAADLGLDPLVRFGPAETRSEAGAGVTTIANPLRLSHTPVAYRRPPPALGADTAEVTAWLLEDTAGQLDSSG